MLCICQYWDVGVVRNEDQLTAKLGLTNDLDNRFKDKSIIQIVLGLVDDQRIIIFQK